MKEMLTWESIGKKNQDKCVSVATDVLISSKFEVKEWNYFFKKEQEKNNEEWPPDFLTKEDINRHVNHLFDLDMDEYRKRNGLENAISTIKQDCSLSHNAFSENDVVTKEIDRSILNSLMTLSRNGVTKPLIPFYVAIWFCGMSKEWDNDLAITLVMLRVQDSAMLAWKKITGTLEYEEMISLQERGLA